MTEELKHNVKQSSTWIRLLYLILFGAAFALVQSITGILALVQFVFVLTTSKPNANLQTFGLHLSNYVSQLTLYLTFNDDELPFPLGPWPKSYRYRSKSSNTQPLED